MKNNIVRTVVSRMGVEWNLNSIHCKQKNHPSRSSKARIYKHRWNNFILFTLISWITSSSPLNKLFKRFHYSLNSYNKYTNPL